MTFNDGIGKNWTFYFKNVEVAYQSTPTKLHKITEILS